MQHDIHISVAKDRLHKAGYSVFVGANFLSASIRNVELVCVRINRACVPLKLIVAAENGADLLRRNGRLYQ
jgi:hypothetical protein